MKINLIILVLNWFIITLLVHHNTPCSSWHSLWENYANNQTLYCDEMKIGIAALPWRPILPERLIRSPPPFANLHALPAWTYCPIVRIVLLRCLSLKFSNPPPPSTSSASSGITSMRWPSRIDASFWKSKSTLLCSNCSSSVQNLSGHIHTLHNSLLFSSYFIVFSNLIYCYLLSHNLEISSLKIELGYTIDLDRAINAGILSKTTRQMQVLVEISLLDWGVLYKLPFRKKSLDRVLNADSLFWTHTCM